ncbi:DUF3299 domain-containing protein [Hylemonella gracilis]|uniref:DUF3299 domain-containing protein n=2 Tax=Hylemonella gracilis TaxID=80880 RepID=A0A4P6UJK3_9BURK|nr:DUF3299 domain-containing protein [Hylemonella gracilis]
MRRMLSLLTLASVLSPLAGRAYQGDPPPVVPPFKGDYQVTRWVDLVPKDWDPYASFDDLKKDGGKALAFNDTSPQAMELLDKIRQIWDNAPTNPALNGALTRLPGYVVPLEEGRQGLKEFLLVPYFGACIHTPPPPANQIVHVVLDKPVPGVRSMDAVWVVGTLKTTRRGSDMGVSGYQLRATALAPYQR